MSTSILSYVLVFQRAPLISLIYISLSITLNGIQSESRRGRTGRDAEGGGAASAHAAHRIQTAAGRKLLLKLNPDVGLVNQTASDWWTPSDVQVSRC